MALTVNTNTASLNAQRNLNGSSNSLATSLERLSSGSQINSAKDDADMKRMRREMKQKLRNAGKNRRRKNIVAAKKVDDAVRFKAAQHD